MTLELPEQSKARILQAARPDVNLKTGLTWHQLTEDKKINFFEYRKTVPGAPPLRSERISCKRSRKNRTYDSMGY
jgi:hypothetical protein